MNAPPFYDNVFSFYSRDKVRYTLENYNCYNLSEKLKYILIYMLLHMHTRNVIINTKVNNETINKAIKNINHTKYVHLYQNEEV